MRKSAGCMTDAVNLQNPCRESTIGFHGRSEVSMTSGTYSSFQINLQSVDGALLWANPLLETRRNLWALSEFTRMIYI